MADLTIEDIIKDKTKQYLKKRGDRATEYDFEALEHMQRSIRSIVKNCLRDIPKFSRLSPRLQEIAAFDIFKSHVMGKISKMSQEDQDIIDAGVLKANLK